MKSDRQSNVELLRILAISGVIVLHYNYEGIGGGMKYVVQDSLNYYILFFLESVFVCAVNLFLLISGFFSAKSYSKNIRKPVWMIVQVMFFSLVTYLINTLLSVEVISIKKVAISLIPNNYFVILFCVVYFLSPYVNRLIQSLGKRQARRLVVILIVSFSIWTTVVQIMSNIRGEQIFGLDSIGASGNQGGYTIVNFLMMYTIGVYIRIFGINNIYKSKVKLLIVSLLVSTMLTFIWSVINDHYTSKLSYTAWTYCNPLVIFEAIAVFLLFINLNIRFNKTINRIADTAFTVFLVHGYFLPHMGIERYVNSNTFIMLIHIMFSVTLIFAISYAIHLVYNMVVTPFISKVLKDTPDVVNLNDM